MSTPILRSGKPDRLELVMSLGTGEGTELMTKVLVESP